MLAFSPSLFLSGNDETNAGVLQAARTAAHRAIGQPLFRVKNAAPRHAMTTGM
jgi:hypothetical protein